MGAGTKERPIPFNDAMVRAILDRRKTMTRRVVKPQPEGGDLRICKQAYDWTYSMEGGIWGLTAGDQHCERLSFKCPYGKPGDRLWVKETYLIENPGDTYWDAEGVRPSEYPEQLRKTAIVHYKATPILKSLGAWKSPRFMPRWASRILLEIVSVRVERLQDISEEDAWAEGITAPCVGEGGFSSQHNRDITLRVKWQSLWESIKGKGSWDANPWVWVIEFKVVTK